MQVFFKVGEENASDTPHIQSPRGKSKRKKIQHHREMGVERANGPSQVQDSVLLGSGVKPQKCNQTARSILSNRLQSTRSQSRGDQFSSLMARNKHVLIRIA